MKKLIHILIAANLALVSLVLATGVVNAWIHGFSYAASCSTFPVSIVCGGTGLQVPAQVNVYNYLNSSQLNAVQSGVNTTDVSSAISNAIASCPAAGCDLYFPQGYYYSSTCNFTISVPTRVHGDGSRSNDNNTPNAVSSVACAASSQNLFVVTANYGKFENIALVDTTGVSRTAGAAIQVKNSNSDNLQGVSYDDVFVEGFYIGFDIQVSYSWHMRDVLAQDAVEYEVSIQNTANQDDGDYTISDSNFFGLAGAPCDLYLSGGGGANIHGNKFESNTTTVVTGVCVATGATVSSQISIVNNHFENMSGPAISWTSQFVGGMIASNFIRVNTNNQPAIAMSNCGSRSSTLIGPNFIYLNNQTAAITLSSCNNVNIAQQQVQVGVGETTAAPNTWVSASSSTVANAGLATPFVLGATSQYDNLYNGSGSSAIPTCNSGAAGTEAWVSDGKASPTYLSTYAAADGAATQKVACNGSNWQYH